MPIREYGLTALITGTAGSTLDLHSMQQEVCRHRTDRAPGRSPASESCMRVNVPVSMGSVLAATYIRRKYESTKTIGYTLGETDLLALLAENRASCPAREAQVNRRFTSAAP